MSVIVGRFIAALLHTKVSSTKACPHGHPPSRTLTPGGPGNNTPTGSAPNHEGVSPGGGAHEADPKTAGLRRRRRPAGLHRRLWAEHARAHHAHPGDVRRIRLRRPDPRVRVHPPR